MRRANLLITGINPEPWTAPSVGIGRARGKVYPQVYKNEQLRAYQEALKESVKQAYPDVKPSPKGRRINLFFYFWRDMPTYEGDSKLVYKNQADATNLQKATEDALQGILYANDRDVVHIESTIVEQGPGVESRIVVRMEEPMNAWAFLGGLVAHLLGKDRPTPPGNVYLEASDGEPI